MFEQRILSRSELFDVNQLPALEKLVDKVANSDYDPFAKLTEDRDYQLLWNYKTREYEDPVRLDLLESKMFASLGLEEQSKLLAYYDCLAVTDPDEPTKAPRAWRVTDATDTTFRLGEESELTRMIPTIPIDRLLLGGLAAIDAYDRNPRILDLAVRKLGLKNRAEASIYVGGLLSIALKKVDQFSAWNTNLYRKSGTYEIVMEPHITQVTEVSADVHGDFRMRQYEQYTQGAITPFGLVVPFAPIIPNDGVGAYHSEEPTILMATFAYLDRLGVPADQQRTMYEESFRKLAVKGYDVMQPTAIIGNFSDWGGEDLEALRADAAIGAQTDFILCPVLNGEIASIGANASGNVLLSASFKNGTLVFENRLDRDVPTSVSDLQPERQVVIKQSEIPDFIGALILQAASGAGRTSPMALIEMVKARLNS